MNVSAISSTSLRKDLGPTLDEVQSEKGIRLIKRNREIDWALVDIDLLEELLELHDSEYRKSIEQARKEAKAGNVYTLEQAFAGI